ncbi:hypothetical protein BC833DRAFT_178940 [Globomyces pollinis-pini]|nr:hypothetical protein BC833DRAFT_178940 [Globomyces pollinis-pini]KAJ2998814.1 hypothetical protein HDV02_004054 [Globomyces sp. JEL0801]
MTLKKSKDHKVILEPLASHSKLPSHQTLEEKEQEKRNKILLGPLPKKNSIIPESVLKSQDLIENLPIPVSKSFTNLSRQPDIPPIPKSQTNSQGINELLIHDDTKPSIVPLTTELRRINIKQLIDTIQPIISHPIKAYTPLLIDPTSRVDTFFQYAADYSGIILEAKKYLVDTFITKSITHDDAMEQLRTLLITAMKHGKVLVIRMSNTAVDFPHKFNDPNRFPVTDLFVDAGRRMKLEQYWKPIVRDEDYEHGVFIVRPEFKVVFTTEFALEDYQEFLMNVIPMNECIPIYIEPPTDIPRSRYMP